MVDTSKLTFPFSNRNLLAIFEFWIAGDERWPRPSVGKKPHIAGIFPEGVHMSPSACPLGFGERDRGRKCNPARSNTLLLFIAGQDFAWRE